MMELVGILFGGCSCSSPDRSQSSMTNVTEEFDGVNGFNTSTYVVIVIQRWRVDLLSGSTWKTRECVWRRRKPANDYGWASSRSGWGLLQSVPEFETADPELGWLSERIFVASGARQPNEVELAVYQVG